MSYPATRVTLDLDPALAAISAGDGDGLRMAVEFLLTEANKSVPHDEGTLERTGTASVDGLRGAVSYDGPYAVRQHEDMALHHDGKGEAKWLENTAAREAPAMGKIVAAVIRGRLDQ